MNRVCLFGALGRAFQIPAGRRGDTSERLNGLVALFYSPRALEHQKATPSLIVENEMGMYGAGMSSERQCQVFRGRNDK